MHTPTITTRTAGWLTSINQLENGERRVLSRVSWEEYEALLAELSERPAIRVSYRDGALEFLRVSYRHEQYKAMSSACLNVLAEELEIEVEAAGSTTLKLKHKRSGADPAACFFIQHAAQMVGKLTYDLLDDPPPDLVVEVDLSLPMYEKKGIYARLGVPELWYCTGHKLEILELSGANYALRPNSLAFPFLQASDLTAFIEQSLEDGQTKTLRDFRAWVKAHKPETTN